MKFNVPTKPLKSLTRRILVAATVAACLFGNASAAYAATASSLAIQQVNTDYSTDNVQEGQNFRVYLNGTNVTDQFEGETAINVTTEGRTILPLRALGNLLGASVDWDSTNKVAILTINGSTIEVPIGSTYLVIDGSVKQIDTEGTQAVILGEGYTYLPFRAVAEACGATVDYQTGSDGSKNIYLTTSGSTTVVTPSTEAVTSDPALAALGIYSATDLGYTATNGPAEGSEYYQSWYNTVTIGRNSGLTDEQITANLQYVYLCSDNGDGTTTATAEQAIHYGKVTENITYVQEPTWSGEYRGQIYGYYMWTGTGWTNCSTTVSGLSGLNLGM